jgi:hypothetical protein
VFGFDPSMWGELLSHFIHVGPCLIHCVVHVRTFIA